MDERFYEERILEELRSLHEREKMLYEILKDVRQKKLNKEEINGSNNA